MAEQLPAAFGNYILLELIARGGMAEIYRAKMRSDIDGFERQVAIKKILPHLAENEEFITMLIDEARICVSLNHANIAQVYDLGRVGETYYIAMEYIPGVDLAYIIKRLAQQGYLIPLEHAIFITKELCAGLYFAHRKTDDNGRGLNIVHRDISPHNLLVSFNGDAKVIDFGVAKASVKLGQTRMGVIKGKLLYMAPEQAMAKPIDGRADIFSSGLSLYKMLTGRLPFEASNEFQIYNKVLTAEIVPPRQINPNVPEELDRIVMKSLERDLNKRYQDCWAMHQDLEQVLHRFSPGYTNGRLSRFLDQHFAEEKAKLTKRISSYPALSAAETSQPSTPNMDYGQGPNTPAGGHRSHPQPRLPEPVHAHAVSYPGAAQTPQAAPQGRRLGSDVEVSYPQSGARPGAVAGGGQATQALPMPPPGGRPPISALPTPESLGFRASRAHSDSDSEEEGADPTVDMRLDPSLLQAQVVEQDADRTQNMDLPPDLVEQARKHLVQHHQTRKPTRSGGSSGVIIALVAVGVLFLLGAIAFIVFVAMGGPPKEQAPTEEPKAEVTTPAEEPPAAPADDADPAEAIKAGGHAIQTALYNAAEKTSAEVQVIIRSEPAGAEVSLGRDVLGVTPLTLSIPRADEAVTYTLKLDGHGPEKLEVLPNQRRELNATLRKAAARPTGGDKGGGKAGGGKAGGGKGGDKGGDKGGLMDPW